MKNIKIGTFEEFMNNHYYGFDSESGKMEKMELFPFQKEIIKEVEQNQITLILKSRQMFMSSLMAYYCAYQLLKAIANFKPKRIFVFCNKKTSSEIFINKVKEIIKTVDKQIILECSLKNNKLELEFYNNGSISIKGLTRSIGINIKDGDLAIVDEAAYVDDFKKLPMQISDDAKIIAYSSPNKNGSCFESLYYDVLDGVKKNGTAIKLHYSLNPFHTPEQIEYLKNVLDNFDHEMELLPYKETNKPKIETKEEIINFRISKELKSKLESKLYNKSEQEGRLIRFSDYLRQLIENDINQ